MASDVYCVPMKSATHMLNDPTRVIGYEQAIFQAAVLNVYMSNYIFQYETVPVYGHHQPVVTWLAEKHLCYIIDK